MSSIDPKLLPLLACPVSRQSLAIADAPLLELVNKAIEHGNLKNVGDVAVTEPLVEGLVREDKKIVYPIRDGIPVLLSEEGIGVPGA